VLLANLDAGHQPADQRPAERPLVLADPVLGEQRIAVLADAILRPRSRRSSRAVAFGATSAIGSSA